MGSALRLPVVLPLAGLVTLGLFLMMRGLIDIGPVTPELVEDPPVIEIAFGVEDEQPDRGDRFEPIDAVEPPPPPPSIETDFVEPVDGPAAATYVVPPVDPPTITASAGTFTRDGNPIPVVRLEPQFPDSEAARGRSGVCVMVFDIMPDGTTANIRTTQCTSQAFARSSIRAVERWRYSPQIENGQPTIYHGARTELHFSLDG